MKMELIKKVFWKEHNIVIWMVHLKKLPSQKWSKWIDHVLESAFSDIDALVWWWIDGVIIENWEDESNSPYINEEDRKYLDQIVWLIVSRYAVPIGLNILPNDYHTLFEMMQKYNLSFWQLDVVVDHVKTNYIHSKVKPFEIKVNKEDFIKSREQHNCQEKILLWWVDPKHYHNIWWLSIEQSVQKSIERWIDVIVVTGDRTGEEIDKWDIQKIKENFTVPICIGSWINKKNIVEMMAYSQMCIVGTSIKDKDFQQVEKSKVLELINEIAD